MEFNKDLMAASSTPIVLAILAEGDSYGYAIIQRVRELSRGRMEWTDGMLYPVLHRLERLGHVEARYYPYLRLAQAYLQVHDLAGARSALSRSEKWGVEPVEERRELAARVDELAARLAPPPTAPPSAAPTAEPTEPAPR